MTEIIAKAALILACIMAVLIIIVASVKVYGEITGSANCAWCHGSIEESSDYVCCSDGRQYHAECYLSYIKEGEKNDD